MSNNLASVPRVLIVTRSGANNTGGGRGHTISSAYHASALSPATFYEYTVKLPKGIWFLRKFRTLLNLRNGYLAGVSKLVIEDFEQSLNSVKPHAVFFDSGLFGPLAQKAKLKGCKVFIQSHNCEYDFYSGEAALRGGFSASLLKAAYKAESLAMKFADVVFVLSAYDKERLIQLYGGIIDCRVVNPHIADLYNRLEILDSIRPRAGFPKAVFLGSIGYQNRLACSLLFQQWNSLVSKLKIVGKVGEWALKSKLNLDNYNIEITGFVDSFDGLLQASDVMVCPMYLGSGIKVKMIDSLANGCPVLASQEAARGFEFALKSGWVRITPLTEMSNEVARSRDFNLSLEQLREDAYQELNFQANSLHAAYAIHGFGLKDCS
jgi:glycosyltransferase involved in cell wall biosynthesis